MMDESAICVRGNEQFLWLQGQIKGLITETSLPGVPCQAVPENKAIT